MGKLIVIHTKDELVAQYQIRKVVFVEEQNVSYEEEFDMKEDEAICFLYRVDSNNIACARAFVDGDSAQIGRVATLKEFRGLGYGLAMIKGIEEYLIQMKVTKFVVHAQLQAVPFYAKAGYKKFGDTFYDANILHIAMKKEI